MDENKGSKGGSRDLRLWRFFIKLLKKNKDIEEIEDKRKHNSSSKNIRISKTYAKGEIVSNKQKDNIDKQKRGDYVAKHSNKKIAKKSGINITKQKSEINDINIKKLEEDKSSKKESNNGKEFCEQVDSEKPNLKNNQTIIIEEAVEKEQDKFNDSKEVKEIILEEKLLKTLEENIEICEYKVKKIVSEEKELEQQADDLLLKEEAYDVIKKIDLILEQIKKLRQELELLISSSNFDNVYKLDDNYFSLLIDEYKQKFNHNFDSELLDNVKGNDEVKHLMERIIEIENFTSQLEDKMNEKLNNISERDDDFLDLTDELDRTDKDFDKVDKMIDSIDLVLKDLEDKVSNAKKVTEQVSYITREVDNSLNFLILSYLTTKNNPLIPKTVGLLIRTQAVLIFLENLFTPRREKIVNIKIEIDDYTKEIKEGIKSLDDVFKLCDETHERVTSIKQDFEKKFSQYDIPEYKEALDKLNELEKNIEKRHTYLLASKQEFKNQLEKNKILIKEKESA